MAETAQEPTVGRNVEWLRGEIVKLFETATKASEPDIPSCTKLAEILFKMLPKGATAAATSDAQKALAEHRQKTLEAGAPTA